MTVESCCGHGRQPYRIFFFADTFEALTIVAYCVAGCHSGAYDWRVIARTDCTPQPVSFMIEGPAGDYEGSRKIAAAVGKWISESGA